MQKLMLLLIPILFLFACEQNQTNSTKPETAPEDEQTPIAVKEQSTPDITRSTFFMGDKSSAQFKGEGNEYASYTLKTDYLYDHYVSTYEDNGGTVMQRIYRISNDKITIVLEVAEAYETNNPTLEELDAMPDLKIYLAGPFDVGTKFDGWKIISTSDTLATATQNFQDVIVIEKIEKESKIRKYFAKDFGEIKREFIMNTNGEENIISSTFEKIM
ncbi:hypothetical protein [Psychrobacillus vulpis]|uniref:Uncharacterized protein n=1 Tax=Psychrobacillus vulpis TaxID=2325572 RepID=A0A544TTA0_9BACI|nr:hypothetical protein [Psychrobacillus vulpis]TQR20669.1 hypothetical protein FG384_06130 [Psychrobacillus vulpis]